MANATTTTTTTMAPPPVLQLVTQHFSEASGAEGFSGVFAVGVLLHLFGFRLGEWDLQTYRILSFFVLLLVGAAGGLHLYGQSSSPGKTAFFLVASLVTGIYSSMLVYRGFFHRLNRFPGPFAARLTNLWVTQKSCKKLHLYEEVQALHETYGDVVRLGPSELSINDPKAVAAIHAHQSPCTKGPWYNVLYPMVSLQMIRDSKEHATRRRAWDRGFSVKALKDYEPRVAGYTLQLLDRIESHSQTGAAMNVTDWFNFYSFDVMGDLAFGKSFGMLRDGVKHYFMRSLHADMAAIGMFSHMLWLFPLFKSTPILNAENKRFWHFVIGQVKERMENKPDRPDVFSWVLADYEAIPKPTWQDTLNLYGDAYLIIVAGSDTTAATLTCLFFELINHPEAFQQLRREVDEYYDEQPAADHASLAKLKYLQACIDETLRLHPPVPSGVQRMTPPTGLQIGSTFVPGNTIVQVPTHTLYRDPRLFPQPNDFVPERWTSRPELVKEASVFAPFSTGKYSCVGKQLGLMEIRYVASQIIHKYDVTFAPGQTNQAFLDGKKDTFTLALGPLNVVFTHRKQG